jgi:hypothetical protein
MAMVATPVKGHDGIDDDEDRNAGDDGADHDVGDDNGDDTNRRLRPGLAGR